MSKYIKLEDAIHNINLEVTGRKEYTGDMKANLFFALDDLPTIEVSEEDLYIPLNNQTVERINRLHKDECGEYFDEEWLFNELEQISEFREVSEDCISREYLKSFEYINKGDFNSVETIREWIDNAPTVAPANPCEECQQYDIGFEDGRLDMLHRVTDAMKKEEA